MLKITLGVDGMMCGMCESHVNDAVRKAFPVKKVTSSHGKGQTVILTEHPRLEQKYPLDLSSTALPQRGHLPIELASFDIRTSESRITS